MLLIMKKLKNDSLAVVMPAAVLDDSSDIKDGRIFLSVDQEIDRTSVKQRSSSYHIDRNTRECYRIFNNFVADVQKISIENCDAELSSIMSDFNSLKLDSITLSTAYFGHLIFNINKFQFYMSPQRYSNIESYIQVLVSDDPILSKKFDILTRLNVLVSNLLIKWKIFVSEKYDHRLFGLAKFVAFLDINDINKSGINLDVLWLCMAIRQEPLKKISTPTLIQYSLLLEFQADSLYSSLLEINDSSISYSSLISTINKSIKKIKLSNFFRVLCRNSKTPSVNKIYNLLVEFEQVYRKFEREMLGRLIILEKNKF